MFSACEVMIRRMNNDMLTLLTSVHVLIMHIYHEYVFCCIGSYDCSKSDF